MPTRKNFPERKRKRREEAAARQKRYDELEVMRKPIEIKVFNREIKLCKGENI